MAEREADPEEDVMSRTTTITGASGRTSPPVAIPQPRQAPPRDTRTTPAGPAVIDLRETPSAPAREPVLESLPTSRGLRGLVARLQGDRPLTVEDHAHAAAARHGHRSPRTEPLAAHAHLMRGLQ